MTHTLPEHDTRGTRPTAKKPTGWIVATTGAAALALAGITAAVFLGFAVPSADATTVPPAVTSVSTSHTTSTATASGGGGSHSDGHRHQAHTASSLQILHWQKDLTTLNYYDGNLDGVMSPEMQQSIRLLQTDAGLPQTGTMDHATQAAMQKMLHPQPSSAGTSASGTTAAGTGSRPAHEAPVSRGSRTAQLG